MPVVFWYNPDTLRPTETPSGNLRIVYTGVEVTIEIFGGPASAIDIDQALLTAQQLITATIAERSSARASEPEGEPTISQ